MDKLIQEVDSSVEELTKLTNKEAEILRRKIM